MGSFKDHIGQYYKQKANSSVFTEKGEDIGIFSKKLWSTGLNLKTGLQLVCQSIKEWRSLSSPGPELVKPEGPAARRGHSIAQGEEALGPPMAGSGGKGRSE